MLDQEVDNLLEFLCRHVVWILDIRLPGSLEIEGCLLSGGRVVVLERDVALELGVEQCRIGIEFTRLFRKVGE